VAARRALELTANPDDGSWRPDAAENLLRENHQDDGELPEFLRGMNYVLVKEMEETSERQELSEMELHLMPEDLKREYYQGGDQQQVEWGYQMPPPEITVDPTGPGEVLRNLADTTGIQFDRPPPLPVDTVGVGPVDTVGVGPVDPVRGFSAGVPIAGITPSVEQTPYSEMFGSNPLRSTNLRGTLTAQNLPAPDTTLSRDEAQRELDALMRRIGQ
jgi:hypothetical protein